MRALRIAVTGACLLLMTACAGGAQAADGQTVNVVLDEYMVMLDSNSISAGKVTFQIANQGYEKHEFVILRTDLSVDSLPSDTSTNKLLEETTDIVHVSELDGVGPGEQKNLEVVLPPGRYLLVCNYPGHAHQGMVAVLTVT